MKRKAILILISFVFLFSLSNSAHARIFSNQAGDYFYDANEGGVIVTQLQGAYQANHRFEIFNYSRCGREEHDQDICERPCQVSGSEVRCPIPYTIRYRYDINGDGEANDSESGDIISDEDEFHLQVFVVNAGGLRGRTEERSPRLKAKDLEMFSEETPSQSPCGGACTGGEVCNPATNTCEASGNTDGDGFSSNGDNCPDHNNADQKDTDKDGVGNVCDLCPFIKKTENARLVVDSSLVTNERALGCPVGVSPTSAESLEELNFSSEGGGGSCQLNARASLSLRTFWSLLFFFLMGLWGVRGRLN